MIVSCTNGDAASKVQAFQQLEVKPRFLYGEVVAVHTSADLHHRDFIAYARVLDASYLLDFGYWNYNLLTNAGAVIEAPEYRLRASTADERRILGFDRGPPGTA